MAENICDFPYGLRLTLRPTPRPRMQFILMNFPTVIQFILHYSHNELCSNSKYLASDIAWEGNASQKHLECGDGKNPFLNSSADYSYKLSNGVLYYYYHNEKTL